MSEGQWVTPREFDAVNRRIGTIEDAVTEIGRDMKFLLAAHNREEGAHQERKELLEATKDKGARRLGWGGILAGGIGALWWVQDAVAKIAHHT